MNRLQKQSLAWSIVIPVYNAEETLNELCLELIAQLEPSGRAFEIILVDDCSRDGSWDVIAALAKGDQRIVGLQLMRNSGQGAATMAGLARARGDFVVTMDDDLQNPPHEVPRLLRYMEEHQEIDAVFGRPREKHHTLWRRAGSAFVNRLSNLMFNQPADFKLTSFRVVRGSVIRSLVRLKVPEPPVGALISTLTKRIVNVDVDHSPRSTGGSGYTPAKLLRVSLSKFLGFSTFPLRLLGVLGMIGIVFSTGMGVYIALRYIFGQIEVTGWTTLALLLVGLSGFMFLAFGIIGEYLQQILVNARQNPTFVIRDTSPDFSMADDPDSAHPLSTGTTE